jgi:penicillin amidase
LVFNPRPQVLPTTGALNYSTVELALVDARHWLTDPDAISALSGARAGTSSMPRLLGGTVATGSNAWVVSGSHTASGLPIIANDPHTALTLPSVYTQVGLFCNQVNPDCPFSVVGFSLAGFPGVIAGHNRNLGWGIANLNADQADLFVEQISGNDFLRDGRWQPMDVREETIAVRGGVDVTVAIRSIDGRPVISDVFELDPVTEAPPVLAANPANFAVTLRWAGLEPGRTATGLLALNAAATPLDVANAASDISAPSLGIVFGTIEGDIGFQAAGLVPLRPQTVDPELPDYLGDVTPTPVPLDGTWPQDGRHSQNDWIGWVPASAMPSTLNPSRGFLVAANQAVLPAGSRTHLGTDFDYGYRAERIERLLRERISSGVPMTVEAVANMQFDHFNPAAVTVVPALEAVELDNDWQSAGQRLLAGWDFYMESDSSAAAYFASAWNQIMQLTFWDELPEGVRPDGTSRWLAVINDMLRRPTDSFWDDRSTLNVTESRDEILRMALIESRGELTTRVSNNTDDWRWGALHQLRLRNGVIGSRDHWRLQQWIVNPPVISTSGSTLSVNATSWGGGRDMQVMTGPAFRMVMDMGALGESTWINVPGNSGHVGSPHHHDQLNRWANGEQIRIGFDEAPGQQVFHTFTR